MKNLLLSIFLISSVQAWELAAFSQTPSGEAALDRLAGVEAVRMTNGQTGVVTGQSADPLVPLCLGGGT